MQASVAGFVRWQLKPASPSRSLLENFILSIQTFQVSNSIPDPARNLVAFVQSCLKVSRPLAEQIVHSGAVRVNDRTSRHNHTHLEVADIVVIDYVPQPIPDRRSRKNAKQSSPTAFSILYDDESIIVVNKPAGLLTVPTPYRERQTLIGLIDRYQIRRRGGEKVMCVHRLDRGVSGVLVFAKSVPIAMRIRDQFAARKPQRLYVTIVAGKLKDESGTFRSYLATDENLNRFSTNDHATGQLAITHWKTMNRYGDASMLQVQLETGRRNQIRVHLAEHGHPVLGDPRYQSSIAQHSRWPHKRIALHAESLGFDHPQTGESLFFQTEWPQEFKTFHRQMRGN